MQSPLLQQKLDQLRTLLTEMGSVVVAYSGGIDSTFVLKVAHDQLHEIHVPGSSIVLNDDRAVSFHADDARRLVHSTRFHRRVDALDCEGIPQGRGFVEKLEPAV